MLSEFSYITSTGYVRKSVAECRLTALCLQYLTFDCFDLETKPERLRSLACQGYLVFQDYAIAYWFYHLGEMVKGADELLDPLSKAQAELDELDVALPEFAEFYEEDIADTDQVEDDIADNDQVEDEITAPFSGRDFYSALKMVMGHVTRHKAKVSPFCTSDPVLQQFKIAMSYLLFVIRDVLLSAKFRNDRESKLKMT